jgi:MoaA/NifB/PqqE/SkfB family radical SAM enzyme
MDCPFCLFYKNKRTSIDLQLFTNLLDYQLINLTGGEACCHPKFNELVKEIVNENFKFGIASNGYEYKKYANLLKKCKKNFKYVTFSLDSHREKIHDRLRRKGSFKKVISAIKYFVKKGVDVKVSICLNKENYKDIEDYVYFIEKLKVKDIRFLSVIPTKKNKRFVLTDKEREECCEKINNLKSKVKTNLRIMSSLNTAKEIDFCRALDLSGLSVNPDGELIFCCDIHEKGAVLGSLKSNNLKDLIKEAYKISYYLREKRKEHLYTQVFFEGFNSCFFCNKILKK